MTDALKILITGGGTGGHVSPALATVTELRKMAPDAEYLYLGSKSDVERQMVEAAGLTHIGLETGKLRRYFSLKTLTDAVKLPVGMAQATREVARFHPDVCFSTGGYVSVPPVLACRLAGCPIVMHEQTVTVGLANKLNARMATKIALTFDGALADLPASAREKAVVTGNPVRQSIFGGDAVRAISRFGLMPGDLPTVYVTGGAQGARIINRAIEDAMGDLLHRCRIIHQCGNDEDEARLKEKAQTLPDDTRERYAVTKFVKDELADVFALCDLIVGRAGAGTVTEACALGKPALFVPLVPTGGDEQTRNARRSVDVGAAQILPQSTLSGETLREAIFGMISDRKTLREMGRAARSLATPNAARDLATLILDTARH